jgi:O-antigen/teichoic acid export membrane protein
VLIAVIALILAETAGLWFVSNKLVIPMERRNAALWIYQFSIISFVFSMLTSPYMAAIISHEDMNIYAYMSIVEVTFKLGIVFVLSFITFDKLKLYGILICVVTIVITVVYRTICTIRYKECKLKFFWNKNLFKELTEFLGFSMIGSIAWIVKDQGMNIVLNLFFGPLLNTARGIASQVNSAITSFSSNFMRAVYPQIVKSYANNNNDYLYKLIVLSSKLNYYLLLFLSIPICLETEFIINLWLKNTPDYVCLYIRLGMIDILLTSFSNTIGTLNLASGNIKLYQILIGGSLILNLPISLGILYFIQKPIVPMIVAIILAVISMVLRLLLLKIQLNFPAFDFFKKVILIAFIVSIVALFFPLLAVIYTIPSFARFCSSVLISILSCLLSIWFLGLNKDEHAYTINFIKIKISSHSF